MPQVQHRTERSHRERPYEIEFRGVACRGTPGSELRGATMLDTQNQGPQCIDQQKESSMALRIRQHDRNPNLWWVSSPEDDVAYIARPGNHYRAWTTYGWKSGHANFVGIPFETIEEALAAVAKEATS
jgi:hypothetical protein